MERLIIGALAPASMELRSQEPGKKPASEEPRGQDDKVESAERTRATATDDLKDQVAAIEAMRDQLSALTNNKLKIDRHDESGQFIYSIFNQDTGETIRRWPPESYLDLVSFLKDGQAGLVDERA